MDTEHIRTLIGSVEFVSKRLERLSDAQLRQLLDALEYEMCNRLAEQLSDTD